MDSSAFFTDARSTATTGAWPSSTIMASASQGPNGDDGPLLQSLKSGVLQAKVIGVRDPHPVGAGMGASAYPTGSTHTSSSAIRCCSSTSTQLRTCWRSRRDGLPLLDPLGPDDCVVVGDARLRRATSPVDQHLPFWPVHLEVSRPHRRDADTPAELAELVRQQDGVAVLEPELPGVVAAHQHGLADGAGDGVRRPLDHAVELLPAPRRDEESPLRKLDRGRLDHREVRLAVGGRELPTRAEVAPAVRSRWTPSYIGTTRAISSRIAAVPSKWSLSANSGRARFATSRNTSHSGRASPTRGPSRRCARARDRRASGRHRRARPSRPPAARPSSAPRRRPSRVTREAIALDRVSPPLRASSASSSFGSLSAGSAPA